VDLTNSSSATVNGRATVKLLARVTDAAGTASTSTGPAIRVKK
jgi:hypothetical protein